MYKEEACKIKGNYFFFTSRSLLCLNLKLYSQPPPTVISAPVCCSTGNVQPRQGSLRMNGSSQTLTHPLGWPTSTLIITTLRVLPETQRGNRIWPRGTDTSLQCILLTQVNDLWDTQPLLHSTPLTLIHQRSISGVCEAVARPCSDS